MSNCNLVFGYETSCVSSIHDALEVAASSKAHFITVPLFHPRFRRDFLGVSKQRIGPGTRSDRELPCRDWVANVVGKVSDWICPDSIHESIRRGSENALRQELAWGNHLGLQAIVLPTPTLNAVNYARCILQYFTVSTYQQLWVRIPLIQSLRNTNILEGKDRVTDGWQVWNNLRTITGHVHFINVAIELSDEITADNINIYKKWAAEPVKAIVIPTSMFIANKTGFPVLTRSHQIVLQLFLKQHKLQIIFKGPPRLQGPSYQSYIQYINHLHSKLLEDMTASEIEIQNYRDRLQAPLQPLMDNLESQTYETFESDTIKYAQYEKAIETAIRKFQSLNLSLQEIEEVEDEEKEEEKEALLPAVNQTLVVTVVGAGRGPLVASVISAAYTTKQSVRIYAVEKNENAVMTLRNRVLTEMWHNVEVVHSDMRSWDPPALADILVSELLGSWGDNELSPECLDGALKCVKPDSGVSIPGSYTSYLSPVSAARLWTGVRDMPSQKDVLTFLDSPFVVKLHNFYQLAPSKPLFTFNHQDFTKRPIDIDNSRFLSLSYVSESDCLLHGFSGTFLAVLYDDVTLSTVHEFHTPNMQSWFPLFLPLSTTVQVKTNDVIIVHIWRCVSSHKVWYEWCLSSPIFTPVQNSSGKSYWIGL